MKKILLIAFSILMSPLVAQTTLTGSVVDDQGVPLPGATVLEIGTNNGTTTDFDGNYSVTVQDGASISASFVGYDTATVVFEGQDLINFSLQQGNELEEIVLTSGVIDLAEERSTPIAVSRITAKDILLKVGNQEFPEIMNNTPGVYATKQGGGYGDSRISLRGFDQTNTSFLINGQPVNDMENGRVYWSNWQGLTDVASGIQIQRGLGATKLAVPSVGGTVSIFTKSAEKAQGGSFAQMFGNNGYNKTTAAYNTGVNDKGWSSSYLLSRWAGNGYINNTSGAGTTYFFAVGYTPEGSNHSFNLSVLGAAQWHHQRDVWVSIRDYQNFGDVGIDRTWNTNGGTLNGEEFSMRRNFYNKPLATFNWDYKVADNIDLNTSFYASAGRGGGTGPRGNNFRNSTTDILPFRKDLTEHFAENGRGTRNADGSINFDAIVNSNQSIGAYSGDISRYGGLSIGSNGFRDDGVSREILVRRASMNSHDWVGAISNLNIQSGKMKYSLGVDLRSYTGYHYRVLNNLMGLDGYYSTGNKNSAGQIVESTIEASPFQSTGLKNGTKIDYFNIGYVGWQGVNGLAEYGGEKITAVLQAGLSNQSFQREDLFDQPTNPLSDTQNQGGGYLKGGANFNFTETSNVFFNAGYISRQPQFGAVFPNFGNEINPDLQNEKITSIEAGYGYISNSVKLSVNVYATNWGNRFVTRSLSNSQGVDGTAQFPNVDVLHKGIEFEGSWRPSGSLKFIGMLSIGDWEYTKDFESNIFDDQQQLIGTGKLFTKGAKVGDAAQFTMSLGADYRIGSINLDANYRFVDGLYADYSIVDSAFLSPDNPGALKLPSFGLVDFGASIPIKLSKKNSDNQLTFRLNVNNLFDTTYIAESNTNIHADASSTKWNGVDVNNSVWFGFGRTWNAAFRYNF